jgi:hypothetical protein
VRHSRVSREILCGTDEKRGIAKIVELLRKHGFGLVFEPKFVA